MLTRVGSALAIAFMPSLSSSTQPNSLRLPPYSPELNLQENVWQYLRQNQLSNRVFASYDAIVEACCIAWNDLMKMPDRIRSIATRTWTKPVAA